jgi:hypothetical protein
MSDIGDILSPSPIGTERPQKNRLTQTEWKHADAGSNKRPHWFGAFAFVLKADEKRPFNPSGLQSALEKISETDPIQKNLICSLIPLYWPVSAVQPLAPVS